MRLVIHAALVLPIALLASSVIDWPFWVAAVLSTIVAINASQA